MNDDLEMLDLVIQGIEANEAEAQRALSAADDAFTRERISQALASLRESKAQVVGIRAEEVRIGEREARAAEKQKARRANRRQTIVSPAAAPLPPPNPTFAGLARDLLLKEYGGGVRPTAVPPRASVEDWTHSRSSLVESLRSAGPLPVHADLSAHDSVKEDNGWDSWLGQTDEPPAESVLEKGPEESRREWESMLGSDEIPPRS